MIAAPSELIVTGNLTENWSTFKTNYLHYISNPELRNENSETKVAIFLNLIGENGLKIFNDLQLSETALDDIDLVINEFESRCLSNKLNSERSWFYTRIQENNETFDDFLASLRKLAKPCYFGNQEEMEIKMRIFLGLRDKMVRDQLANILESTLDSVASFCRSAELFNFEHKDLMKASLNVESNQFNRSTEHVIQNGSNFGNHTAQTINHCGLSGWHPEWLQKLANPKVFLIIYGLLGTTQSMKFIYFNVTLTTLERRFKIPSETTGILMTGNEISQILLSLILSYAGGGKNRPRWISWGVAICALSCYVLVLPHVFFGGGEEALQFTEEYDNANRDPIEILNGTITRHRDVNRLCSTNSDAENSCISPSMVPLVLIFISQFILGIGNTLYYSLGHSYLDDSMKKTKTPMMLAYVMSLRFSGSVFGFALGYFSLSIFVDPTKTPMISNQDPRWVGAWWLGWIIIGSGMLLFALLIGMFPRNMPRKLPKDILAISIGSENCKDINDFDEKNVIEKRGKVIKPKLKDFPAALRRILQNKLLIYNILSSIFFVLGSSVYVTFLSKYMEVQFNRSKANATLVSGPVKIIGLIAGFLLSGFIISKYRPSPRKLFFWNIIVGCSYMISQICYLFLFCDNGTSASSLLPTGVLNLSNTCNVNCFCDNVPYSPVCHRISNVTYFSPCHAGCRIHNKKKNFYEKCDCIGDNMWAVNSTLLDQVEIFAHSNDTIEAARESNGHAENKLFPGLCSTGCDYAFYTFNIIFLVKSILGGTGKIGNILLNLRVVSKEDKSIAQGLALMLLSLFAFIPGPILFGHVIDNSCLVWKSVCGARGYCQLYDQTSFRYHINLIAFGLTSFGVIFDILVWILGKNVKLYEEDDDEENENDKVN